MPGRLTGRRLGIFTAATAVLAVGVGFAAPALAWLPLSLALGGAMLLLTQRVGDSTLTKVIAASFVLRCALALTLFAISAFHLPILSSLHRGEGLWQFGGDGDGYQDHAVRIVEAWRDGIDLPSVYIAGDIEYDLYKGLALPMALVYEAFGVSVLNFMLVNVWIGALSGVLAYLLALRLGSHRQAALAAAALIAFWPSAVIWSTQLLKDPMMIACVLAALLMVVVAWQRVSRPSVVYRATHEVAIATVLVAAVFGLTYFRHYLGALLTFSVGFILAVAGVQALMHRRWRVAAGAVIITLLVAVATLAGATVDLLETFSPRHPEVGHVRRGDRYRAAGDIDGALRSYQRAIALNQNYAPAYRELGVTLLEKGDQNAAVAAFNVYSYLEPDKKQRLNVAKLVAPPESASTSKAHAAPTITGGLPPGLSPTAPVAAKPRIINAPNAAGVDASTVGVLGKWSIVVQWAVSWLDPKRISLLRLSQERAFGGTSVTDTAPRWNTMWDLIAYVPKAVAIAYLAPFPWQLAYTGGNTGAMRPMAAPEVLLIALLLPAFAIACWRSLRHFTPESAFILVFIAISAVAHGLVVANGGTLFRLRLQFLFPTLILAAGALPDFIYRQFARLDRRVPRAGHDLPVSPV